MKLIKGFKVFVSLLSTIAMLAVPIGLVGCTGGCKSSPSTTAYKVSGVTHASLTAALRGWNDYLSAEYKAIAALPDTDATKAKRKSDLLEKEKQLKSAWEKYQASQIAVLTAAQEFSKIPPSDPNAPSAQDRLNAAVAASSVTLNAVIDLLRQFGVKVN